MAIRVRLDPIDRDVRLIVNELLSPDARRAQFAADAQALLDEADAINRTILGRIPLSHTYVNGQEGDALSSVTLPGIIVREYELVIDVLEFIAKALHDDSPVGKSTDKREGHPGFYQASHTLFADGVEVEVGDNIPPAQEYVFLSDVPYARKIEKIHSVYEMTADKAARRFGNIARVYFGWRKPASGQIITGSKGNKSDGRFPAIIVNLGK